MNNEIPQGAVDLAEVKERADERDRLAAEAAQQAEYDAAVQRARAWDRAMTRAFKGIVPAPRRRKQIARAIAAEDVADA